MVSRRLLPAVAIAAALSLVSFAAEAGPSPEEVQRTWTRMVLSLTRHTPTYSPPVASRTFAYLGIAAYEAVAAGNDDMVSLAGQLPDLAPAPAREAGAAYDEAVVLEAAMSAVVTEMFANTGPSGQRALAAQQQKLDAATAEGVTADVVARSRAFGIAIATHIIDWSRDDGGREIVNMGFPLEYDLVEGPGYWVPTNTIVQQQTPLLPDWGRNRPFALPATADCPVPATYPYSEEPDSAFYKDAREVYDTKNALTPEQAAIARFWSDDPMLSWTPPGHWFSILLQILERDSVPLETSVDVMMRLALAEADAFIGCWDTKFEYNLIRPLTYIRRVIDPGWDTLINTPPFPEYTSGHSVASAAAAVVLTAAFGEGFGFDDTTGEADGLPPRSYAGFWDAANEAGISRLYGGIHFRAAIDNGLAQGRCIGQYAVDIRTRK